MRGPLPMSELSMKSACPCPAGDHSTRQWLTRSAMFFPPSSDRRMNEFSPVITTSCGSTIWASAIVVLLCGEIKPGPDTEPAAPDQNNGGGEPQEVHAVVGEHALSHAEIVPVLNHLTAKETVSATARGAHQEGTSGHRLRAHHIGCLDHALIAERHEQEQALR